MINKEGIEIFTTRCSSCQGDSQRSEDFDTLELGVEGHASVQSSLDQILFPEMLEGDNQYYCDRCAAKSDATRSQSLSELPPVLNVQLLRYVYDRTTTVRGGPGPGGARIASHQGRAIDRPGGSEKS